MKQSEINNILRDGEAFSKKTIFTFPNGLRGIVFMNQYHGSGKLKKMNQFIIR